MGKSQVVTTSKLCVEKYMKYRRHANIIGYLRDKSWMPECFLSFNMGWRKLVFDPEPEARDKIY
jgi:hypothetical protein